ncbi:hypothetical protein SDC9_128958 [bioreactor metagenome]|uniref:Uncharacterized protein n=1 Tax=bioreactor metagenome TaxID=1076179 RepID=A0A645CYE0_9ZZZZ
MLGFPCATECVHGGGLARSGWADEDIEHLSRHGDSDQSVGLVVAEQPPLGVGATRDLLYRRERHRRPGQVAGAFEQPVFGRKLGL